MADSIMVGCDLHKKTMVLRFAVGAEPAQGRNFGSDPDGRQAMISWLHDLRAKRGADRVLFAYEASSQGFGLHDDLREAGIECFVLAPSLIPRSAKHARGKNDGRDANQLLEILKGHVLAGNALPAIWVPDLQTRDDRELVRMRLTVADKLTQTKNQIQHLLKRNELRRPEITGAGWTQPFVAWLKALSRGKAKGLGSGGQAALASLLRQIRPVENEIKTLDKRILMLSQEAYYAAPAQELQKIKGVGLITAMVFLSELGNLSRFANRRQLAAYLGLIPSSHESGERNDCKGHITRQGSGRVRKILCQATWSVIGNDAKWRKVYDSLVEKNPKHKKIAVVAIMRRLSIILWHRASEARGPGHDRGQPPAMVA